MALYTERESVVFGIIMTYFSSLENVGNDSVEKK